MKAPEKVETIGPYEIIKPIAKGGMGEVWLAFDLVCNRNIALKKVRNDIKNHQAIAKRFLKEARLTANLTHPGIITIYTIAEDNHSPYYTMPYVEGKTLRQILKEALKKEHEGTQAGAILSLLPTFISICQTVSYAHSKGIIHRDLKPENVLVGKFGEVILLDWGLALSEHELNNKETDLLNAKQKNEEDQFHFTLPGKIVGTLAFLSPERALGSPATVHSDIYSLGVILYQILTLRLPFHRNNMEQFQKNHDKEKLIDPQEIAPYRDVPPRLSSIVKKCLSYSIQDRYQTVEELIHDVSAFIEGRAEWYNVASLEISKKEDWEFQENVFLARHAALTHSLEGTEWVSTMISKTSFAEDLKMECTITLHKKGGGIGFLLNVPEQDEREDPLEGYCLWLGSDLNASSQLFRNTASVMKLPELILEREKSYHITLEKRKYAIYCSINGIYQFTYISYLPLIGTHIGILSRDADFTLSPMNVFIGNQTLKVNCLAIPDAFLASKDYGKALAEYRRIGYSFPGHAEGREALFRAGVTLLEQGKAAATSTEKEEFFHLALIEFAKLQSTAGAPLEYLGKSLVYATQGDLIDEIKCLELALRRFPYHPLVAPIKEQILYRMHETAQKSRPSAYRLILIALKHLPYIVESKEFERLYHHLTLHWEPLPFFEEPLPFEMFGEKIGEEQKQQLKTESVIVLSFWLAEPYFLLEVFQKLEPQKSENAPYLGNLLYALFELGAFKLGLKLFSILDRQKGSALLQETLALLRPIVIAKENGLEQGIQSFLALKLHDFKIKELRTLRFLFDLALHEDREERIEELWLKIKHIPFSFEDKIYIDTYRIWAYLRQENWKKAEEIFLSYPLEFLNQDTTLLHSLFGCWLYAMEGYEISSIHFAGVNETPFPRSWTLLAHELTENLQDSPTWMKQSFLWEKRQLYRYLILYYQCAEDSEKEAYYRDLERKEYIDEQEV